MKYRVNQRNSKTIYTELLKEFGEVMIIKLNNLTSHSIIGIDRDNREYKLDIKWLHNVFGDIQDKK